jgi:hypothetical protein
MQSAKFYYFNWQNNNKQRKRKKEKIKKEKFNEIEVAILRFD